MAKRSDRRKWRLPCEIRTAEKRSSGLVLNVSGSGLFIQTNAMTMPGQRLELVLSLPNGQEAELEVRVARKKVVPPQLLTLAQGGVGVRVLSASASFVEYLRELDIEFLPPRSGRGRAGGTTPAEQASGGQRFRVRVSQVSGPRSRRLEVEAADADAAGAAALQQAGEGWKVLDVEAL